MDEVKTRTYGFDKTIHRNESVDVEVDREGRVVSVWFRCQHLPFRQSTADAQRAEDMRQLYSEPPPGLVAVELLEEPR